MKAFVLNCIIVAWVFTSCANQPYAPSKVEAAPPPYESAEQSAEVRKLLKKGVPVEDWRTDGEGICRVHKFKMETIVVVVPETAWICVMPVPGYVEAKERYFPNVPGPDTPAHGYRQKLGKIYVCPKCISAQKLWYEWVDCGHESRVTSGWLGL